MKISIISAGSWGTALGKVLCDKNHTISLYTRNEQYAQEAQAKKENFRYLAGFKFPNNMTITSNLEESILESSYMIVATPVQFLRQSLEKIKALNINLPPIILVSKGIEKNTLKTSSTICEEVLPMVQFACLAGPSHAEEVVKSIATAVVIASKDEELTKTLQNLFTSNTFRVYSSSDVTGVEIAGALKNIFAIASGIIDGLNLGDNTKAALVTRAIVEKSRFALSLGGKKETISSLSGIGDLIVTCYSKHSRNRFVGEQLGKGLSIQEILKLLNHSVSEGIPTTLSAYTLARQLNLETPIIDQVYNVIYNDKNINEAFQELMNREPQQDFS